MSHVCLIAQELCSLHPNGDFCDDCLDCPDFLRSEIHKTYRDREEFCKGWEKDKELEAENLAEKMLPKILRDRIEGLERGYIAGVRGASFLLRCYKVVLKDVEGESSDSES